ncbi:NSFL1 cofactor p47 [Drosophila pseudoobscura]|uniref:NSFL1 cofactor p47 n=1 Tax=Drosophila pseudoobscura pseudoobscura TaxID=46245 RepID=A0A6I8VR84_DROPS|nr:NSFL1 cofactor p47 [Drosophila pseudoobscura]
MSDEQKLQSFMRKHDVQEDVARRYLVANDWALDQASGAYESDTAAVSSSPTDSSSNREPQSGIRLHTDRQDDDPEKHFAENSNNTIAPGEKRVSIESSTPALTYVDSLHSVRVWGQGRRLGSAHPINPPAPGSANQDSDTDPNDSEHTIVVLHLWSEGFSLDDGSLRLYDVPENAQFLQSVLQREEKMQGLGQRLEVSVQDHSNEPFRRLGQFLGPGRTLGDPLTRLANSSPSQSLARQEQHAEGKLSLNEKSAMTTVQLRLSDGSRISARFNRTHNVGDVYRYVRLARPQYSSRRFVLITSFPRVQLDETDARSLADANLCNVVVIQHLEEEQPEQSSSEFLM